MARNFYFGSDTAMAAGSAQFSALINEDAAAVGLTDSQAVAYHAVDLELQTAMREANTPTTRTPVSVARKNAAVKAMQAMAAAYSRIIHATETVSETQLVALSLLPRPRYARRKAPTAAPRVRLISTRGHVATIRVCDAESGTGRSKPFAAIGAEVFWHIGDAPPERADAYRFECMTSRTTKRITFPNEVPAGANVWISTRWVTARGEYSHASAPLSFSLAGGDVVVSSKGLSLAA